MQESFERIKLKIFENSTIELPQKMCTRWTLRAVTTDFRIGAIVPTAVDSRPS